MAEKQVPFPNPFQQSEALPGYSQVGAPPQGTLPRDDAPGRSASYGGPQMISVPPPPAYTATSLVPLSSRMSKSKRYYFVPQQAISCVMSDGRVVMSQKTQKKSLDLFTPDMMDIGYFLRAYAPWFVVLGPILPSSSWGSSTEVPANGYVCVNPLKLVECYANSESPSDSTCVDVEQNVAGRGDHAEGEAILQFKVKMPLCEVLARLDPAGYANMLRDPVLSNLDLGFGIRMCHSPRVDYPKLSLMSRR